MEKIDYYKIAKEYAASEDCDIVQYAGEEDGWHYFSYTKPNLPKYGSLPGAMRINDNGIVEKLGAFDVRFNVSRMARLLQSKS